MSEILESEHNLTWIPSNATPAPPDEAACRLVDSVDTKDVELKALTGDVRQSDGAPPVAVNEPQV